MPKASTRHDARSTTTTTADTRAASRASRRPQISAGRGPFNVPPPKGKNPGPIPISTAYVPPETPDEEAAAFADLPYRESTGAGRNRAVSRAALSGAQARMRGRVEETEPDDQHDTDTEETAEPVDHTAGIDRTTDAPYDEMIRDLRIELDRTRAEVDRLHTMVAQGPIAVQTEAKTASTRIDNGGLFTQMVYAQDIDRLWDWIRRDKDLGMSFLSRSLTSSIELHALVGQFAAEETYGTALLRTLYADREHVGFVMLSPILSDERTAILHLYIRADLRTHLVALTGFIIEAASRLAPGIKLAISALDPSWGATSLPVLKSLGFVAHTLYVR